MNDFKYKAKYRFLKGGEPPAWMADVYVFPIHDYPEDDTKRAFNPFIQANADNPCGKITAVPDDDDDRKPNDPLIDGVCDYITDSDDYVDKDSLFEKLMETYIGTYAKTINKDSSDTMDLCKKTLPDLIEAVYQKRNTGDISPLCPDEAEYILHLEHKDGVQYIVFGDLHGSFHAFVRSMKRLQIMGIINEKLELQPNYVMIFLGDIVDRGNFGMEIMYVILKLMHENWGRVFLNKGNHEEEEIQIHYGFRSELSKKCGNRDLFNQLHEKLYSRLPSSILITDPNRQNNNLYLSHGGFPILNLGRRGATEEKTKETWDQIFKTKPTSACQICSKSSFERRFILDKYTATQCRWSDYLLKYEWAGYSLRGMGENGTIGRKLLEEFQKRLGLAANIRGHNDNIRSALILKSGSGDSGGGDAHFDIAMEYSKQEKQIGDIQYYDVSKAPGKLASFPLKRKITADSECVGVVTISSNNDLGRLGVPESFLIVRHL
jgi:hypothetical protein